LLRQQRNKAHLFVARVLVQNTASFFRVINKAARHHQRAGVRAWVGGWMGEHAFMNGKIGIYRSLALQHPFAGVVKKTGFPAAPDQPHVHP